MKQVFLLLVLLVVAQWFGRARRRVRRQQGQAGGARNTARAEALPEPIVRCTRCGVYVPKSEVVTAAGQSFCCGEHARQQVARAPDR